MLVELMILFSPPIIFLVAILLMANCPAEFVMTKREREEFKKLRNSSELVL